MNSVYESLEQIGNSPALFLKLSTKFKKASVDWQLFVGSKHDEKMLRLLLNTLLPEDPSKVPTFFEVKYNASLYFA